jgi:asparagine synthase (glutamine-hydrolysing)
MCGLTGFLDPSRRDDDDCLNATVLAMADTLHRRGPDDRGAWVDRDAGVALGFRRLAIVDLTPEGHQPMLSAGGRYVLVFNGEVYNHEELRHELQGSGSVFRGRSDTEVMLAAFERWGLVRSLERFVGMYAFAVWDRAERTLHLARDRMGEKPLYYGWSNGVFFFGSELKALRAHPEFSAEVDRDALALFMRFGYVPSPHSILRGIHKLLPGTCLSLEADRPAASPAAVEYWSARRVLESGADGYSDASPAELTDRLEGLLRDSVRGQMVADVPLGAFLSGGIDSSTIVALMQAQSARPVKTFTIGFEERDFDEAPQSRAVAAHLGTDHTELYITPDETLRVIPELGQLFDEPFADWSSIPTFLVARLARREVTVSLSGDGGDELFGGYPWYGRTPRIWSRIHRVPRLLRRVAARAATALAGLPGGRTLAARATGHRLTHDRVLKFAELLEGSESPEDVHRLLTSQWFERPGIVLGVNGSSMPPTRWDERPSRGDVATRLMLLDAQTYLTDDIMAKVDRTCMGVSLESRAPLLDHRIVEFALRLPADLKIRDGRGKWLLREVLDRHVPRSLIERPKAGFDPPVGLWLRGPLRDWAATYLDPSRIRQGGLLDTEPIGRIWSEHCQGQRDWSQPIWNVLMFQCWHGSFSGRLTPGVSAPGACLSGRGRVA